VHKLVLVTPDLQEPYEDRRSVDAVLKFASDHKWDHWIDLGDRLDFDFISRFSYGIPRLVAEKSFQRQYDYSNKSLDRWVQAVRCKNKKAKISQIEGNHDARVEHYIDKTPESEGILEVPTQLHLKERKIDWIPFATKGKTLRLGKATFLHGLYANEYHAKKHVLRYMTSVFYGHVHDLQSYSLVKQSKHTPIVGQSLGCLCDLEQEWMKGRPHNWQQGFGVFWFEPGGHFSYYVIRIINHKFRCPWGKAYSG